MPKKHEKTPASATLLVELLTEELPPKPLPALSEAFGSILLAGLAREKFLTGEASARTFATPRRLAVSIPGVPGKAPDRETEVPGPSVKAALDAGGNPTPALVGFARKNGVDVKNLVQIETPKGRAFACRTVVAGARLDAILARGVQEALVRLPIPRIMRWGSGEAGFVRPVHGLVMMHGSRVVPGEVLGIKSNNQTLGHRFLGTKPITLRHADDYERALREEGRVIASFPVRRDEIAKELTQAAGSAATSVADDALLDEIAALVEEPTVYAGEFSAEFLTVPQECLILSMQQHQRYVPLRAKETGRLLPRFLFVSNIDAGDPREIIHGNERVLRARLADAKFFYDQDRKIRLEARVPRLAHVVHHHKLGSQLERVERIQLLAGRIARQTGADPLLAERAAWLSKADLLTEMVGEFPELQGTMGRYYALHDGEPEAVAGAVADHYRPRFAGDDLPNGGTALAVALADKHDALAGIFGIGLAPTGDKDPFALRRAALGVVRILVERKPPLALDALIADAAAGFAAGRLARPEADKVREFVLDRLRGYLRDRGFEVNEIEAVVSQNPSRLDLVIPRLKAVQSFRKLPEAEALASANKRIRNILRQAKDAIPPAPDPDHLPEEVEKTLYGMLQTIEPAVESEIARNDFGAALQRLATMRGNVDRFFDQVMVMADDAALRRNRLALLSRLNHLMNRVADLSRLAA